MKDGKNDHIPFQKNNNRNLNTCQVKNETKKLQRSKQTFTGQDTALLKNPNNRYINLC